mmetsp:Transcript_37870/g.27884  ORF Transcript_37870/g.27884 Transcript_37870/m.27884 type:complete len:93 (+) Transcript_37870:346-624(+)
MYLETVQMTNGDCPLANIPFSGNTLLAEDHRVSLLADSGNDNDPCGALLVIVVGFNDGVWPESGMAYFDVFTNLAYLSFATAATLILLTATY